MEYTIDNRPVFTTLTVNLNAGETLKADAGAMVSMSSTIELKSKTTGKGIGGMFKAAIGGEGFFSSEFTALSPGEPYIVDTGHMVAFEESVNYNIRKAARGLMSSVLSREGEE